MKTIILFTLLTFIFGIFNSYAQDIKGIPVSSRCISKGAVLVSASDRDVDLFSVYLNNKNKNGVKMLLETGRIFSIPVGSDLFIDTREMFYNEYKFHNVPIYVMPDIQIRLFMDREFLSNLDCKSQ